MYVRLCIVIIGDLTVLVRPAEYLLTSPDFIRPYYLHLRVLAIFQVAHKLLVLCVLTPLWFHYHENLH